MDSQSSGSQQRDSHRAELLRSELAAGRPSRSQPLLSACFVSPREDTANASATKDTELSDPSCGDGDRGGSASILHSQHKAAARHQHCKHSCCSLLPLCCSTPGVLQGDRLLSLCFCSNVQVQARTEVLLCRVLKAAPIAPLCFALLQKLAIRSAPTETLQQPKHPGASH